MPRKHDTIKDKELLVLARVRYRAKTSRPTLTANYNETFLIFEYFSVHNDSLIDGTLDLFLLRNVLYQDLHPKSSSEKREQDTENANHMIYQSSYFLIIFRKCKRVIDFKLI